MEVVKQPTYDTTNDPLDRIIALAEARRTAARAAESVKKIEADLHERCASIYEHHEQAKAEVAALEAEVRTFGLQAFEADPADKHPYPGVDIAVSKTPPVAYPADKALDWCKEHDMFLQVNAAEFDAFCLTSARPDFAEIGEPKATVRLATDLDAALAKAGVRR